MKLQVLFSFLAIAATADGADAQPASGVKSRAPFQSCPRAEFANCTQASCKPGSKPGILTCTCPVEFRSSATDSQPGCVSATATTVQSRYHPVAAHGQCVIRKQAWAACLGVMCEKTPGTKTADCRCRSVTSEQFGSASYIIVTNAPYASQCASGTYYSSATPEQVTQISSFLYRIPPRNIWFYPPDP